MKFLIITLIALMLSFSVYQGLKYESIGDDQFETAYKPYSDQLSIHFQDLSNEFMKRCYIQSVIKKPTLKNEDVFKKCAKNYINHDKTLEEQKLRNFEFSKAKLNTYSVEL